MQRMMDSKDRERATIMNLINDELKKMPSDRWRPVLMFIDDVA